MNTIQQTVIIPADRRLRIALTLPADIPTDQAEILLVLSPAMCAMEENGITKTEPV
jgi:hypothetical protein